MELLTVGDVAKLLHLRQRRAYELMTAGMIPSIRLGGRIVVPRRAFEAWFEAQVAKALEPSASGGTKGGYGV